MLSFATHKIRRMEEATKLAKVTVANAGINEVSAGGGKKTKTFHWFFLQTKLLAKIIWK